MSKSKIVNLNYFIKGYTELQEGQRKDLQSKLRFSKDNLRNYQSRIYNNEKSIVYENMLLEGAKNLEVDEDLCKLISKVVVVQGRPSIDKWTKRLQDERIKYAKQNLKNFKREREALVKKYAVEEQTFAKLQMVANDTEWKAQVEKDAKKQWELMQDEKFMWFIIRRLKYPVAFESKQPIIIQHNEYDDCYYGSGKLFRKRQQPKEYNLGYFRIGLTKSGEIYAVSEYNLGTPHPHVSDGFCFGSIGPLISQLLANSKIYSLLNLTWNFLTTGYNPDGAFTKLPYLRKDIEKYDKPKSFTPIAAERQRK